jgi:hypothetical protein
MLVFKYHIVCFKFTAPKRHEEHIKINKIFIKLSPAWKHMGRKFEIFSWSHFSFVHIAKVKTIKWNIVFGRTEETLKIVFPGCSQLTLRYDVEKSESRNILCYRFLNRILNQLEVLCHIEHFYTSTVFNYIFTEWIIFLKNQLHNSAEYLNQS